MLHTIFSKLDKRLFRPLCVAVASVVLAFSCIVPAQAVDPVSIAGLAISGVSLAKDVIQTYLDDSASNAEKQAALQGYKDHWISKDNISDKCFLTYDALCQIVIDLNNAGQPAKISSVTLGSNNVEYYVVKACGPFGYTSVQSQFGFGATSIWNNYGLFYSTSNRVLFCAQVNTDLSLDSCLTQLRLIQTNVVTIKNSLVNTIGSNLESLLTTCNTISTKLDTLTSVISNGKVLVDNSDVVSAIQSIPAYDDTEITGYVGSITEFLNSFSRTYDGNYTKMLQQVTFLDESLAQLRKHVITGNRHTSEIIDMLTAAVDADTGKLLVADTAVTSAIADLTDSLSVPTGKCAHDWQLTSTGQPGTPAVTNVRLPAEYQEVEYLENTSEGAYINTGAVPSLSGTKFHIKYQMLSGSYLFGCGRNPRLACAMRPYSIQFYIGSDGSPSVVNYTLAGIFSKVVAFSGYLTGSETGRYLDITVDGTTSRFIPPDGAISGSFSDSLPFYLFAWQYGDTLRTGRGRIWGFSMEVGGNLIRDMVPCYRKADNVPGFYDLVSGSFSTNAGTGSFVTGADVPVTIVTPEIPTTYDTYTCSICGEKYVDYDSTGAPEVTGVTIPFTRWFHGKFQEYEASLLSAIDAIPAYDDTAVIAAIQSIPAPTDYTSQLTAVTGRMDNILAQLQSTSGSATCEHTYSQHMEQEATCILPGLMISTCSKCGDSSSEIVDPLGHDWQCTSHVDAVTDPDSGEETSSAYDIYTCSRCGDTYEDHTGTGAPDEDYSNTTISQLVVKVFSKLGTFAGKLLGSVVHLFDKAVNAVDDLASKFNDYVEQIKGFGENYPIWLSGFWGIIPAELQVALTFAVICMALGVVGKKLFFS